jgi:AcrR family transcriptional regulator
MSNAMVASSDPAELRAHFRRHLRNVPAEALATADSLGLRLSSEQSARLRASADSLAPRLVEVTELLVEALAKRRTGGGDAQEIDDLAGRGLALVRFGAQSTRALLTPQQWGRLPRPLRANPRRIPRPAIRPPTPF